MTGTLFRICLLWMVRPTTPRDATALLQLRLAAFATQTGKP